MIIQHIKKYPEPAPYVPTTYSSNYNYGRTPEQEIEWAKKCKEALADAKKKLQIGDRVSLKFTPTSEVTILGFIEDPKDCIVYQEQPCVIQARNMKYPSVNSTKYAIHEFLMDTLIKFSEPEAQNDE